MERLRQKVEDLPSVLPLWTQLWLVYAVEILHSKDDDSQQWQQCSEARHLLDFPKIAHFFVIVKRTFLPKE